MPDTHRNVRDPQGRCEERTLRPSATRRREMPSATDVRCSVAAREHRFRKQGSSARQNASPTSVVQCHGAQTRFGPRGGGRLRVLSPDAVAPPSLFASPALPADAAHRALRVVERRSSRRQTLAEVNHASDARRNRKRIGSVGSAFDTRSRDKSAGPVRNTDSSTVGDTSPRDAFPRRRAWFTEASRCRRIAVRRALRAKRSPPRASSWFAVAGLKLCATACEQCTKNEERKAKKLQARAFCYVRFPSSFFVMARQLAAPRF